jgi:hypothetical protein
MTTKQHTPGPWTVTHNGYYHEIRTPWPGDSEVRKNSPSLASVFEHSNIENYSPEVAQANANLIAAAPELLEGLEIAMDYLPHITCEWATKARSAIAKAKGEAR